MSWGSWIAGFLTAIVFVVALIGIVAKNEDSEK